jgi:hypothetical protein
VLRALLIALVASIFLGCTGGYHPNKVVSDKALLTVFERERSAFDSLAAMLSEDEFLEMISVRGQFVQVFDSTRPNGREVLNRRQGEIDPRLPLDRWDRYARLIERIDVRAIYRDSSQFYLQHSPRPEQRGYVYVTGPLDGLEIVQEDLMSRSVPESKYKTLTGYRPIATRWYLFRQARRGGISVYD